MSICWRAPWSQTAIGVSRAATLRALPPRWSSLPIGLRRLAASDAARRSSARPHAFSRARAGPAHRRPMRRDRCSIGNFGVGGAGVGNSSVAMAFRAGRLPVKAACDATISSANSNQVASPSPGEVVGSPARVVPGRLFGRRHESASARSAVAVGLPDLIVDHAPAFPRSGRGPTSFSGNCAHGCRRPTPS